MRSRAFGAITSTAQHTRLPHRALCIRILHALRQHRDWFSRKLPFVETLPAALSGGVGDENGHQTPRHNAIGSLAWAPGVKLLQLEHGPSTAYLSGDTADREGGALASSRYQGDPASGTSRGKAGLAAPAGLQQLSAKQRRRPRKPFGTFDRHERWMPHRYLSIILATHQDVRGSRRMFSLVM